MKRMTMMLMLLILIFTACTNNKEDKSASMGLVKNEMHELNDNQLEELKPIAKNLFSEYLQDKEKSSYRSDLRIKDYLIHNDIKIFKNDYDTYYIFTYDTLPATDDYVLAGNGEMDDRGWHINQELLVELMKENDHYKINVVGTGP